MKKNPDNLSEKVPPFWRPAKYPAGEMSGEMDYAESMNVARVHAPVRREHPEPVFQDEARAAAVPLPGWLLALCGVMLFWSGGYFFLFSGGFRSEDALNWNVASMFPTRGAKPMVAQAGEADPVKLGETLYAQNCVACHQASGQGVAGQFPPLAGSDWVTEGDKRPAAIILKGIAGPMTVKGQSYNNAMPAIGATLTDKKVAAILTYVRQAWGNQAGPVTTEAVAQLRKELAPRAAAWTAEELLKIIPADATLDGGAPAEGAAPQGAQAPQS